MAFFTKEARELIDYIGELNAKANGGFELTTDLKHWAGYGVTTKEELGDYLDECVKHEDKYEDSVTEYQYDPIEPNWDMMSRHDMNEGW